MRGFTQETLGARTMFQAMAAVVGLGVLIYLLVKRFCDEASRDSNSDDTSDENSHLIKSESACSCGSGFADKETER